MFTTELNTAILLIIWLIPGKGLVFIPAEYVKENGQTQLTVPTKQFCLFRELKPEHRIEAEEYEYEDTNHKQTELFY